MDGDFSRITYDEFKHYVGVLLQQGRVQLDSDWNEQVMIFHDLLRKNFVDVAGDIHFVGDSFSIGTAIPLDHMTDPSLWNIVKNQPDQLVASIVLDTSNRPRTGSRHEKGCLLVRNASEITRDFASLDLSKINSLYLKVKPLDDESAKGQPPQNFLDQHVMLKLYGRTQNGYAEYRWLKLFNTKDPDGFYTMKFVLNSESSIAVPALGQPVEFDLSEISKISIEWSVRGSLCIGSLEAEPFVVIVATDTKLRRHFWVNVNEGNSLFEIDAVKKYAGQSTIKKKIGIAEVTWDFQTIRDFSSINNITFSSDIFCKPALFLVTDSKEQIDIQVTQNPYAQQQSTKAQSWYNHWFSVKSARADTANENIDFSRIKAIGIRNLPEDEIRISEILAELSFENDFLIVNNSLGSEKQGRMYVEGILCQREHYETYLTQGEYHMARPISLGADTSNTVKAITYLVYADVWIRGVTHIEDPEIREIALNGSDTATRLKVTSQVKIKELEHKNSIREKIESATSEMQKLSSSQKLGRLSTVTRGIDSEKLAYTGLDNRLYKIQIHDSGDARENPATFKWSKDNGSLVFPVSTMNPFSVILKPTGKSIQNMFMIGDIIEVIDDSQQLSEIPKGALRRITDINLDEMTLSWASTETDDASGLDYLHSEINAKFVESLHPKIIKWDGIKKVSISENTSGILLVDDNPQKTLSGHGIRIQFTDGIYVTGDYWNFTVRVLTGEIERLANALPKGIKHHYVALALIEKEKGKQIKILEDLRKLRSLPSEIRHGTSQPLDNVPIMKDGVQGQTEEISVAEPFVQIGKAPVLKGGEHKIFSYKYPFDSKPIFMYNLRSKQGKSVGHQIEDIKSQAGYEGFFVVPDDDATIDWIAMGNSSKYDDAVTDRLVKKILQAASGKKSDNSEPSEKSKRSFIDKLRKASHEKEETK